MINNDNNKKRQSVKKELDKNTIEIIKEFVSEAYFLLEDAEKELNNLEHRYNKESIDKIFRLFHSLKGSASFLNFENIKSITHNAENILDLFRNNKIKPQKSDIDLFYTVFTLMDQILDNVSKYYTDEGFEDETNEIVSKIKQLRFKLADNTNKYLEKAYNIIQKIEDTLKNKVQQNDVNRDFIIGIIRRTFIAAEAVELLELTNENEKSNFKIKTLLDNILNENIEFNDTTFRALLKNFYHTRQLIFNDDSGDKNNTIPIGEILIDMGLIDDNDIKKALDLQKKRSEKEKDSTYLSQTFKMNKDEFRVDIGKVNQLFNYIGEISISGEQINSYFKNTPVINQNNFKQLINTFNKNLNQIQNIILSIRTVSMENFFNKMKRVVKQVSKKLKKEINFITKGASTEIDKNLIDEVTNPIIHLLRNAIDHGIETKEIRLKKNKPSYGNIELIARQEGSEIWISIKDDGKGIDSKSILKIAKEKNLIDVNVKQLNNDKLWDLLSLPGFSTSKDISDISGRGVGMDVVKKTIEKVNGNIEILTDENKGTEVILKIPVTMEIVKVITFDINNSKYSIPTRDILETISIKENNIIEIDEKNLNFRLRDEIVPLIFMEEVVKTGRFEKQYKLHKIRDEIIKNKKGFVIILNKRNKKFGLYVNGIESIHKTVVKPLPDYIKKKKENFIFGCSIYGKGEISFIIDTIKLIKIFKESSSLVEIK